MYRELLAPLVLTGKLWWRFWPQLTLLVLIGILLNDQLLWASVQAGYADRLLGLSTLTLVVLTKLIVTVTMFLVMRPALPALAAAHAAALGNGATAADRRIRFPRLSSLAAALTITLLPFFAYYAGWGLLSNTVREYSMLYLHLAAFGGSGNPLDVATSSVVIISVLVTWLLRRLFKTMHKRTGAPVWRILIIVCETNWAFIGLYVLSQWKDEAWAWVESTPVWDALRRLWEAIIPSARAAYAAMAPVEQAPPAASDVLTSLFYYAILPVVWLMMAAVIYGHDIAADPGWMRHRRLERVGSRYSALPRALRDFIDHFVSGYRSRYLPIANSVRLTLGSGLLLILMLIVAWRAIGWAAIWARLGISHLIGPHDVDLWVVINQVPALLFGSVVAGTQPGLLPETLRFCLVAAVLETAFALSQTKEPPAAQAEVEAPAS
ncbi:hypothetical protein FFK22_000305 [Mycobacterium sp. KBS0706]|uniref:hypothetical protein n=1 Tax=Mycobacterium sp. KBS0706 TaxID=2578109 RepID=UPI00110F9694|nr:hypothetical protein [Mycobacterium sp. KBS0706]TSD90680.1 hypothetical protein FFK22_000305 [Mycobacterium sp. KBS0706]